MTALDAALEQLSKAMAGRPYVVVYDSCHPESEVSMLQARFGGAQATLLGLLVWGKDRMMRQMDEDEGGA